MPVLQIALVGEGEVVHYLEEAAELLFLSKQTMVQLEVADWQTLPE
jgi:hypothetical protein